MRGYINDKYIPIKDYNEGFPPTSVTTLGNLEVDDVQLLSPLILTEGEVPENIRMIRQLSVDCLYLID